MANWLDTLTNKHVRDLSPYESARRLFSADTNTNQQLWLNANEAPEADEYQVSSSVFNRYPDCQPQELISAYASYAKLSTEQVIASRGADEGIELIIRAFCEPGNSSVLICPPTYGMYAISAQTFNVGVQRAPLKQDYSLDLEAIAQYVNKVNVVFLCSPNNPTGTRIAQSDIIKVLELFRGNALVVLDEAYIEFDSDAEQSKLLQHFDNLIILRTLSKAFALAGLRCGFVLSNQAICKVLMKVIAPYPVPAPVAQVASQALSENGLERMQTRVKTLQQEMSVIVQKLKLIDQLEIRGDHKANFVLFRSPHNPDLMQYLVSKGVIIRDQSKQLSLQNCLRITVGTEEENQKLLTLIDDFFQHQASTAQRKPA